MLRVIRLGYFLNIPNSEGIKISIKWGEHGFWN
jgi:hypothetical protein